MPKNLISVPGILHTFFQGPAGCNAGDSISVENTNFDLDSYTVIYGPWHHTYNNYDPPPDTSFPWACGGSSQTPGMCGVW